MYNFCFLLYTIIKKRDVGIAYITMREIHYHVMLFRDTLNVDEAEVLAGRFS